MTGIGWTKDKNPPDLYSQRDKQHVNAEFGKLGLKNNAAVKGFHLKCQELPLAFFF